MRLLVVVPAFNEEGTIAGVIAGIPPRLKGIRHTVVLVLDDGSTDRTAEVAEGAGAVVVSHPRNRGVGAAFGTGLRSALEMGADIMVNIDADGQFSGAEIPLLIAPILDGRADFVCGDRFTDEAGVLKKPAGMPGLKFIGNQWMSRLIGALAGRSFRDVSCGFRAYSREAMLSLNLIGRFTYTQETFLDLANKGLAIETVPVKVAYFAERRSRVAGRLMHYMIQTLMIILRAYRDYRPLLFFAYLGLPPFAAGLACGLFVLGNYVLTGAFTPYKVVGFAGVYLFSLGLLLWILGLLGDMLVRLRLNQEQLLYYEKSRRYGRRGPGK